MFMNTKPEQSVPSICFPGEARTLIQQWEDLPDHKVVFLEDCHGRSPLHSDVRHRVCERDFQNRGQEFGSSIFSSLDVAVPLPALASCLESARMPNALFPWRTMEDR